jgi:hypothetical protein
MNCSTQLLMQFGSGRKNNINPADANGGAEFHAKVSFAGRRVPALFMSL